MTVTRTPTAIIFDPPVSAESLGRLPVRDKRVVVGFVGQVVGHKPSDDEILNFLRALCLLKEGENETSHTGKEEHRSDIA